METLWTFKSGVTQSFTKEFRKCKLHCRLRYVEGWTPKVEPIYFRYGHVFHHILQHAYLESRFYSPDEIEAKAQAYIDSWEINQKENFFGIQPKQLVENKYIVMMARKVLTMYFQYRFEDFNLKWIGTEKEFKIPYNNTFLRGCIDGMYINDKDQLCLMDHKCLSVFNADDLIHVLPHDTQVNLYVYAAYKLTGKFPKSLTYNIIRRSRLIKKKTETEDQYISRICNDIVDRPAHYFVRINIPLNINEVHEWMTKQFSALLAEIYNWEQTGYSPYPYNEDALITKYGRSDFFELIVNGNTSNYYQRKRIFAELDGE